MLDGMERWERDEINRRFKRLEEAELRNEERFRALEWRDGARAHINIFFLFWIVLVDVVAFEIVMAATKG